MTLLKLSTTTISSQPLNPDGAPAVDANNNPILNSRTEQYGYDELSRLTTVDYGDGGTQSYSFDNMGNRLQKTDSATGTQTNTFDAANRLTSVNGAAYTNDLNGNTLTGGGRTNTWDSQNRLTQCTYNNGTSSYVYGADGLRHRSVTGTTANPLTTDYALDGQNVVQDMCTINGALTPIATYLTGPNGPMYRRDDGQGSIRWYVYDGLDSVVGEVDPNGVMTARRGFDVYGATRSSSGIPSSKHGFVGGLGHTSEDESGLVYMRARYYDPGVGRFVSEDPAGSGGNWYVYASCNPTNRLDKTGKADKGFWDVLAELIEASTWGDPVHLSAKLIAWGVEQAAVKLGEKIDPNRGKASKDEDSPDDGTSELIAECAAGALIIAAIFSSVGSRGSSISMNADSAEMKLALAGD